MSESGGVALVAPGSLGAGGPICAVSGVQANAAATATLPAVAGKTTFLTGFQVTAAGATAAAVVTVTTAGLATNLSYVFVFPAGATVGAVPLVVELGEALPASAPNTAISVTLPASGAGGTAAAVVAHGYQA